MYEKKTHRPDSDTRIQSSAEYLQLKENDAPSLQPPDFHVSGEPLQMKKNSSGKKEKKKGSSTKASLPSDVTAKMEDHFDHDFSKVDIVKDSEEALDMDAQAYTQGNSMHFAPGKFDPGSSEGEKLLKHELTHVVQQRQGRVNSTDQINGRGVNTNSSLEAEADAQANTSVEKKHGGKQSDRASSSSSVSGNAPVQRLTFFAHGFIPDRDAFGNKNRSENGERVENEDYNGYWKDIDDKFTERFENKAPGDANTHYLDGSAGALSSAQDRYEYGIAGADAVYAQLKKGDLEAKMNNDGTIAEMINVVGHSMGGAYAAGFTQRLLDINSAEGKKIFNVRSVYYLAPHQPMDFTHPAEVRGVQHSHENDAVSSRGFLPWGSGSSLGPINGIHEYVVHDKKGMNRKMFGEDAHRGGHNVEEHDYIFDMFEQGEEGYVASDSDEAYDNYQDTGPAPEKEDGRFFHLPKILDAPGNALDWGKEKARQAGSWVKDKANQAGDWTKKKAKQAGGWVKDKANQAGNWTKKKAKQAGGWAKKQGKKAKGWLKKKGKGIKNGLKKGWKKFKSWF